MRKVLISIIVLTVFSSLSVPAQPMVSEGARDGVEKIVRYDVSKFTDTRDRKLEDVLNKMPGLTLSDNGNFSYNKMSVVKVYVNGMDIPEGNYLPLFNLKPEDVEAVEVLENHLAEKVLRGMEYSNAAGVNIILKPSARSRWSGSFQAAGGFLPALYRLDVNAANYGSDRQTTALLKLDNTGLNYGDRLAGFGTSTDYSLPDLLSIAPSLAPLNSHRVRLNESGVASLGSSFRLGRDLQLHLQLLGHSDRLKAHSLDETTYYLDGGDVVVDETGEEALSRQRDLQFSAVLLSNTDRRYLNNTLLFNTRWSDVDKLITGSYPGEQAVHIVPFHIRDEFNHDFRVGQGMMNIELTGAYLSKPQRLQLDLQDGLFLQEISHRSAYLNGAVSLRRNLGPVTLRVRGGVSENLRFLETGLRGTVGDQDTESRLSALKIFSEASLSYISERLQAVLKFPLNYGRYGVLDVLDDTRTDGSRWYFSPSLSLKWDAASFLALNVVLSANSDEINRDRLFPGVIFQNFRNASRGIPSLDGDFSWKVESGFSFRYPAASLFFSGTLRQTWTQPAFVNAMEFSGNYIYSGFEPAPAGYHESRTVTSWDLSKGIEWLKGKIGSGLSTNSSSTATIRGGKMIPSSSSHIRWTPYVNGRIFSWMNMNYSLYFNWTRFRLADEGSGSRNFRFTQIMELIFTPWQRFNFSVQGEHYYTEFSEDQAKHLVLADFKAEYILGPRWVLQASVTNLLGQDTYNYTLMDNTNFSRSFTAYSIRPRDILLGVYHAF